MQKYLTQNSLNAFTIRLPRHSVLNDSSFVSFQNTRIPKSEQILFNRFSNFIQANFSEGFDNLPLFNFLITFYNVQFIEEKDDLLTFKLFLNEALNRSIWLRLKHTIFNQYNALIGFSEVLKEVEVLDDTDRLLIDRINVNAREMFQTTKLLMEFEQIKNFSFNIDSRLSKPFDYFLSFIQTKQNKGENISIDFDHSESENVLINIEHVSFNTSLNLLFDVLKEVGVLSIGKFFLDVKKDCHIYFECKDGAVNDNEFIREIKSFNHFFEKGINLSGLSSRVFKWLYIKLITEKLGGEFNIGIIETPEVKFQCEWIFPMVKKDATIENEIYHKVTNTKLEINIPSIKPEYQYPIELRREIASHFSLVEGTFVLDEWKTFADKLAISYSKYKIDNLNELNQIVKGISSAINGFDIKALQLISLKIKQISKTN